MVSDREILAKFRQFAKKEKYCKKIRYLKEFKLFEIIFTFVQFSVFSRMLEFVGIELDEIKDILFIPERYLDKENIESTQIRVRLYLEGAPDVVNFEV